jgi:CheY-like chemotaxis protein
MPGMDGLALARAIKASPDLAGTRLILLTSLGVSDRDAVAAAGIAAALTKPVRQSQLFDTLARVMGTATPAVEHPEATGPRSGAEPTGPPATSARILVVEDSAVNQQVALGLLKKLGYHADAVATGLEALEALERIPYAVVLMDCQMPEMDGYEASTEVRRREGTARHTPIVALTAHAMQGDRERCLAAGMDDYISKPVRFDELAVALRRWVPSAAATARAIPGQHEPEELSGGEQPEAIDESAFASLDPDIVVGIIHTFLQEVPPQLAALQEAAAQGESRTLENVAHLLRGTSGAVGAHELRVACAQIEQSGREGTAEGVEALAAALDPLFQRAQVALEATRARQMLLAEARQEPAPVAQSGAGLGSLRDRLERSRIAPGGSRPGRPPGEELPDLVVKP